MAVNAIGHLHNILPCCPAHVAMQGTNAVTNCPARVNAQGLCFTTKKIWERTNSQNTF